MDVFHVKDRVGVAGSETRVSEGGQSFDNDYDILVMMQFGGDFK